MTETWAEAQFDLLEEAYNEIPIEAKAHIEQLESSLDEVAEKWAIAQVNYEDCARRNTLLEALVRDWCDLYENPDYGDCIRLRNRMKSMGLLRDDAE